MSNVTIASILFRGRAAWVAALILGMALLIVGLLINKQIMWTSGIGLAALGLIAFIVSFVSK